MAGQSSRDTHFVTVAYGLLPALLMALAVAIVLATARAYWQGAAGYVDNGDGYYLYAAHRLAQGAILYREVMGTQPPLVYMLAAAVFKLGGSLATLRLVSAALRAVSTALVCIVGLRMFGDRLTATLAALTYALLPIGLAWDRSFDVNPPLAFVALLALWPLLRFTPRAALLAGLLAALALFTKDLYAPLLVATLAYLALRRRHVLCPYLVGLGTGLVALAMMLVGYAGPAGLRDAFLGQQASPFNAAWFVGSVRYVASLEGAVVLVALTGAYLCRHESDPQRRGRADARDYAPWLLGGASAVLLATLKEGTFGSVFQLAEPAVALLAAYGATWALNGPHPRPLSLCAGEGRCPHPPAHGLTGSPEPQAGTAASPSTGEGGYPRSGSRLVSPRPRTGRGGAALCRRDSPATLPRAAIALALPTLLLVSLISLGSADRAVLAQSNAAQVARVVTLIRAHARPGATIVAPPYYALLTGTRLPGDAADAYILAQRVHQGDPWATRWVRRVTAALRAHSIPVVLIDLRSAAITPLMAALRARYRSVYGDTLPPALHVEVWLPVTRRS